MLAEVQLHLRKLADAEATLRRVIELAPGDAESYLALERVLVQENKIADAIAVLEKLVAVEPKRARELYQRMAQYALQLYKDDDAIKYAARAVELNPDDAEGHRRLGEMYRSRQDAEHAIVEFRAAIAKNDRLYVVYFELADLLLSKGQTDEADRLFRRVVRGAPDEELVARAARLSMQINLGKGTLESLEQELLPLAIGNPQRPIYRRLLVEIYGNLTFGLVQRVRRGSRQGRGRRARGARAHRRARREAAPRRARRRRRRPAAHRDRRARLRAEQERRAAALRVRDRAHAEAALRTRAMIACGALRDAALLPKYEALLFPKDDGRRRGDGVADRRRRGGVGGWRAWATSAGVPLLRRVAQHGPPTMRALAVLGLGCARQDVDGGRGGARAARADAGNVARAAAAYALGELGATSGGRRRSSTLAEGTDALPREMALLALARMARPARGRAAAEARGARGDGRRGVRRERRREPRARRSVFGARCAGSRALVAIAPPCATAKGRATPWRAMARCSPSGRRARRRDRCSTQLVPRDVSAKDRAAALVRVRGAAAARGAGRAADVGEPARARCSMRWAAGTARSSRSSARRRDRRRPPTRARRVVRGSRAERHRRSRAIRIPSCGRRPSCLLRARRATPRPTRSLAAIEDPSETVQRVALAAIGPPARPSRAEASARLLGRRQGHVDARELGDARPRRAGAGTARRGGAQRSEASAALAAAATRDAYALVREAALVALASFDSDAARTLAARWRRTTPSRACAKPRERLLQAKHRDAE